MSAIFDSYNNIKPNNMHEFCQLDRHDDVVVGGTAVHVFHVNFNLFDLCREFEITYTKGLSKLFVFSQRQIYLYRIYRNIMNILLINFIDDEMQFFDSYNIVIL